MKNVNRLFIGIDPGMAGAIAVRYGSQMLLYDIPTKDTTTVSGNNRKSQTDIDIDGLVRILDSLKEFRSRFNSPEAIVVCEHSAGMALTSNAVREAHFDNSKTAWKKGYNFGVIRALFHVNGLEFAYTPRPGDWKRKLGLTDSSLSYGEKKEMARLEAIRLFPAMEQHLRRKKDSDRAEALLLTVWAEWR